MKSNRPSAPAPRFGSCCRRRPTTTPERRAAGRWRALVVRCGLVGLGLAGGGCAVVSAGADRMPPLDVPAAPPRVVAAFPPSTPLPAEPGPEVSGPVANTPVAVPAPERPRPPRRTPPADPEPAPEPPPEPATETPQLRPALESGAEVDADDVRRSLDTTAGILNGLARLRLDTDDWAQRDTARRFHDQATTALEAGDITFAYFLSEKAETLARDLQAR